MGDMSKFDERFERLKVFEEDKNGLIEDLLREVRNARESLNSKEKELERTNICTIHFQEQLEKKDAQFRERQQEIAKLSFVSVLIDGDCMNFIEGLVEKGATGGHEAVQLLKTSVGNYIRKIEPETPANIKINIYVYANVKGLAKTYRDANVISDTATFDAFKQGFNMEDGLCEIVDAGTGKECTDEKLRARFHQHILDVHCHHIVFGGSADNGYARLLGPHRGVKRISLLEGPPFARELVDLVPSFRTTAFENIFRGEKLVSRRVSFSVTPPRTPAFNYATAASKIPSPPTPPPVVGQTAATSAVKSKSNIGRNIKGQRVDIPLRFSQTDIISLKKQKLCNQYHISGSCRYGNSCGHPHGKRVTGQRLEALKHLARMTCCPAGLDCQDEDCVQGHRCQKAYCEPPTCWFPPEMHGVDTTIVDGM